MGRAGERGVPVFIGDGMMQQAFAYPFMYWVGMNTPPDTDPAAVAEFSRFYSTVHVPEVVASNPGFVRGTRWERHRAFRHPQAGCPRFCALYEADGAATQANRQRRSDPTPKP